MVNGAVGAITDRPVRVLADIWPRSAGREVALVVGAAAMVGVAAQITVPVPGSPVPITGQTFAVLLAGAALGPARGAAGMLLYVVAGAAGLPWFAGGTAGVPTATFGYLIGFVLAAGCVGRLAAGGADRRAWRTIGMMAAGTALIYLIGVPWLMVAAKVDLSKALTVGMIPYLPGDAVKAMLAAGLLPTAWRLLDRRSGGTQG
ncbi:biotin transporter BioY [Luedemannella flava]|uniref:Biotin transporter n=1 Tax=Luedemannella flava TaxID=349316 RepID=A0ABP4XM37_9ACTN